MRFIAPLDTVIYGIPYAKGAEVATDDWNRAQFVQMLSVGMIALNTGADVAIMDAVAFTYAQSTPASVWSITHPLDFTPNVLVVDSAGTEILGDTTTTGMHGLTITFTAPFSGTAYLS